MKDLDGPRGHADIDGFLAQGMWSGTVVTVDFDVAVDLTRAEMRLGAARSSARAAEYSRTTCTGAKRIQLPN